MHTVSRKLAFARLASVVFLLVGPLLGPVRPLTPVASAQPEERPIVVEDASADLPPQSAAASPQAPAATTYWTIETVDPGGVGRFSSLVIDSADQLHVGYYDDGNTALRYANFDGTDWLTTTVDNSSSVGQHASLGLDASETPHISYYESEAGLRHAYLSVAGWVTELVDYSADVGEYSSLAVGRTYDDVLVSYYDASNQALKFARLYQGAWMSGTLDAGVGVSRYSALDAARYAHIVYYDATTDQLKYVEDTISGWDPSDGPVNSAGDGGFFPSLALDSNTNPHVSYFDDTTNQVIYAHHNGTNWGSLLVDAVGFETVHTAIAVDANDRPHFAYHDDTNDTLLYAYFSGTRWTRLTVDDSGTVGGYPRMVQKHHLAEIATQSTQMWARVGSQNA